MRTLEPVNKVIVKFLKNDLPYMRDELAAFDPATADMLIRKGCAERHGDGRPKPVGGRIPEPEGSGVMTPPAVTAG